MDASMAGITIYNMPQSPPNWDRVGVFYIAWCVTWSTLLFAGMIFCWFNRRVPIIRVRGLALSFPAILMLHVYWVLGQITYPVGATMPTVLAYDVQYFGMGIYFPIGIALFQASNLRFLHVAKMQKQYAYPELRISRHCNGSGTSLLCRLRNMQYMTKTLILIGIGIAFQFAITVGMWLACAKYHPTYGIPGTEIHGATLPEQIIDLGRGWEWWPTLVWQFIWTWIAAPILLIRAWGIRDTMGWRVQTIGCCIFSLHATPMFLIATYHPAFTKVNVYFTPSQWIHFAIMMWEIFTVFVPVFQVIKLWILHKKAVKSMAKYESSVVSHISSIKQKLPPSPTSPTSMTPPQSPLALTDTSGSTLDEKSPFENSSEWMADRLYTMDALELTLAKSPEQLQEFAALSDFSGENIAFLSEMAIFKIKYPTASAPQEVQDAFNHAIKIYAGFISTADAEFPLNISSKTLKPLQAVFERPTRLIYGEREVNSTSPFEVNPFEFEAPSSPSRDIFDQPTATYTGVIPIEFSVEIFDEVQEHIKYLVLTNTWPKFVETIRRRSEDSERSDFSAAVSESSFKSWISNKALRVTAML